MFSVQFLLLIINIFFLFLLVCFCTLHGKVQFGVLRILKIFMTGYCGYYELIGVLLGGWLPSADFIFKKIKFK